MKIPDWQYMQIESGLTSMSDQEINEYKDEINKSLDNIIKESLINKLFLYIKCLFMFLLTCLFWLIQFYLISSVTDNKDIIVYIIMPIIGFLLFIPFINSNYFNTFTQKEEIEIKELKEIKVRLAIRYSAIKRNIGERKSIH